MELFLLSNNKYLMLLFLYLDTILYNSRTILIASKIDKLNKME